GILGAWAYDYNLTGRIRRGIPANMVVLVAGLFFAINPESSLTIKFIAVGFLTVFFYTTAVAIEAISPLPSRVAKTFRDGRSGPCFDPEPLFDSEVDRPR